MFFWKEVAQFKTFYFSLSLQLEEVKNIPANSEKIITDASAQKEVLEKDKVKEEAALAQVMEHLKEETSGLQQEKEVCCTLIVWYLF